MLLTLNALVLALAGWRAFDGSPLAHGWLVALAAAHLGVGLATRATRISRELRLLALALGAVLADVAAACAVTAAAAFVAGRFAADIRPGWRAALDGLALAGVAYLSALTLDGAVLAAALAAQAVALAAIAARGRDDVAAWAPARSSRSRSATRSRSRRRRARSVALVTPFPGDLGQSLLSGLWAMTGLAGLVAGLVRDERLLRIGSLALLLTTIAKVFLYDLAALESLYRVGSFIALGLLLLLAAGLWQRLRPRPLPDLRTAPPALR